MNEKLKFITFCIAILFVSIAAVSASENVTDDSLMLNESDSIPDTPVISINTTNIKTGDSIGISLKDSNDTPLYNQKLNANINNENYTVDTDFNGEGSLKLSLKPNSYVLNLSFKGNENYSSVYKIFNIKILKSDSDINVVSTTIIRGNYFSIYLKNQRGEALTDCAVSFTVNGKTYKKTTNSAGKASLKISALTEKKYVMTIKYGGSSYYNSVTKDVNMIVRATTTVVVGNDRLLSNGYLKIYLKSYRFQTVSKKTLKITVGTKTFTKTTNTEGVVSFKPKVGEGTFNVSVEFEGSTYIIGCNVSKIVKGIKGDAKSPFKAKIPLKNGVPDVDYMLQSYIMADGDMSYTLLKDHYKSVIKRDSYCLFLNKKLSKYTVFKSKAEPKYFHIIKREKWNVIERALNVKIVKKNKYGYWPSQITVNLNGKEYTYAEVRDVQNTGYTCGPTSCSMCSQVLRNYINEKQLGKLAGSNSYYGSSTAGLKKALEKNHFKCTYYYKSSFNKALKELKKGGCALVFHTWNHYVSILDISKDGKKVLVGNPSGDYDYGSHSIPTKWLTVKYMKKMFNNYDTSGLIVKLKYNLKKSTKKSVNYFYNSMGTKWTRQNTSERIPNT